MAFDYNGIWTNQLQARMLIMVNDGGVVTGWFESPTAPGERGKLSGFVRGNVIVFSNSFKNGMGTMLGQPVEDSGPTGFQTWWHFRPLQDDADAWSTVRTGCDTFTRVE